MTLARGDFAAFFAETHSGHQPHRWQERLLDHVVATGRWPERIDAPTGAGKTAVIGVHVFAQALTVDQPIAGRPPRRLAMVVNRRVLVDDQYEYAMQLARSLRESPPDGSVLAKVASDLRRLRGRPKASIDDEDEASDVFPLEPVEPLVVARLRGGAVPPIHWRDDPRAVSVICATPEMWGSRILFRGYGSASRAWARDAGLLVLDAAVVVDEAHLSRQLLVTAKQVARLSRAGAIASAVPTLQVVETSATPDRSANHEAVVGVSDGDLEDETASYLRRCLTRPKRLRVVPVAGWTANRGPQRRALARAVADQVELIVGEARCGAPGTGMAATVGCYVNTVGRAVDVANELQTRLIDGRPMSVVTICGQVRPFDLVRLRERHPKLLSIDGDESVDVIVTTQSLEVGVDLDLSAVVTDLAPGPAIVQRVGRVNRRGQRASGTVVVVGPDDDDLRRELRSGPYGDAELRRAWDWLHREAERSADLSPWQIRAEGHPSADRRRLLLQRPELSDVLMWSRTSDALAAEPELDLWLNEDLEQDLTVGLVVRDQVPPDPEDARRLAADMGTLPGEVFSVPLRTAMALLAEDELTNRPVVRIREDDVAVVQTGDVVGARGLRPGDTIVVDAGARIFTRSRGDDGRLSPPVPLPRDGDDVDLPRFTADDVYVRVALQDAAIEPDPFADRRSGEHRVKGVVRIESGVSDVDAESFGTLADEADRTADSELRASAGTWLSRQTGDLRRIASVVGLRAGGTLPRGVDVVVHTSQNTDDGSEIIRRFLVVDARRSFIDDELRQVWSPREQVTLDAHQAAVAERASEWALALGLPEAWVGALWQAGFHHDDGKAEPRFQKRLEADEEGPLLAKSGKRSPSSARRQSDGGLPSRWRHEQYSVVRSWRRLAELSEVVDHEVVARLIGTSHGHGRVSFPHTARGLLGRSVDGDEEWLRAAALFDAGEWDQLIDDTDEKYGVWGCAYLEAILRGADGVVSGEGR